MSRPSPTLLVVSDTHGAVAALAAALAWGKARGVEALAFLGDGAADLPLAAERTGFGAPRYAVRGNGDHDHGIPHSAAVEFAGRRFFLCHGHLNGVLDGLTPLLAAAASVEADAVLYGHTHRPFWEEFDGVLALNPGSLGRPRTNAGPSFATIECPPNEWFIIRFWSLHDGPMGRKTIREIEL